MISVLIGAGEVAGILKHGRRALAAGLSFTD
jgi:hypothetical protein